MARFAAFIVMLIPGLMVPQVALNLCVIHYSVSSSHLSHFYGYNLLLASFSLLSALAFSQAFYYTAIEKKEKWLRASKKIKIAIQIVPQNFVTYWIAIFIDVAVHG